MVEGNFKVVEETDSAQNSSSIKFLNKSSSDFDKPFSLYLKFDLMKIDWFAHSSDDAANVIAEIFGGVNTKVRRQIPSEDAVWGARVDISQETGSHLLMPNPESDMKHWLPS